MDEVKLQFFGLNPFQKFQLISDILLATFSIIIFSSQLFVNNYSSDIKNNSYIKDIITNWNMTPIIGFEISNPSGIEVYKKEINQSILYSWEGTIEGCDCQFSNDNISIEFKKINNFSCEISKKFNDYCKRIKSVEGKNIKIYKGKTITPILLKNNKNYLELINRNNEQCADSYKKCGILDSNNNILCLPLNVECPINKIIIDKNSSSPIDFNYTTLSLENGFFFHYTSESINSSIIVSLKLSEGNLCLDLDRHNSITKDYELYLSYDKCFCNNEFDYRYNLIDFVDKKSLFDDNGITDSVQGLPNFTIEGNFSLYSRNYIGINSDFAAKNGNNNKLKNFIDYYKIFNLINIILSFIFMIISLVVLISNGIRDYSEFELNKYNYIMKIISIILIIIYLILIIIILNIKGNSIEILDNLDKYSFYATREIKWKINIYSNIMIFILIIICLNILLIIFWFNLKTLSCCLINDSNKIYGQPDSERPSRFPSRMVGESLLSNLKSNDANEVSQN